MTELTHLMSGDPTKRRIVLDACLTSSHHVAAALHAAPADAAADVNAAIAANPSLRDFVAGVAGVGANVFGSSASFAPAQTTFMAPGTTDIGLSVPGDPDLIAASCMVEFGTSRSRMRAVLECWSMTSLRIYRDAMQRHCRRTVTHVAGRYLARGVIQPLHDLVVNQYSGSGDAAQISTWPAASSS
jgi:hypothetical protein